jgi:sodium-dependent dicarboxylate transporter 2/3/5
MLPVATPPNAIAFGTEYVDMKGMITTGWFLNLLGILLFTLFIFTVGLWAFGITLDLPAWALTTTF